MDANSYAQACFHALFFANSAIENAECPALERALFNVLGVPGDEAGRLMRKSFLNEVL